MPQIIQARVFQKTDTLANWMSNPLVLGLGEQAFVVDDDGNLITTKIGNGVDTFSNLNYPKGGYEIVATYDDISPLFNGPVVKFFFVISDSFNMGGKKGCYMYIPGFTTTPAQVAIDFND